MTVITAHQPGYLPAVSLIEKVEAADMVIWLDAVQYSRGSYTNRTQMPDGSWLTVPVRRSRLPAPICHIQIDYTQDWTRKHARTLQHHYGQAAADVIDRIEARPYLLVTLNLDCLRLLLPNRYFVTQTQLGVTRGDASTKLARMVRLAGGDVYLSGPSGRNYLDERPFKERGIRVEYFDRGDRENPCAMSLLARTTA